MWGGSGSLVSGSGSILKIFGSDKNEYSFYYYSGFFMHVINDNFLCIIFLRHEDCKWGQDRSKERRTFSISQRKTKNFLVFTFL